MELAQKNKFQELVMNNTWIKTVLMFLLTLGGLFVTTVPVNAEESSHPQEGQVVTLYSNGGQYSTNPNIQPKKSLFSFMLRSKNQGYSTPEKYWYNGKWTHYINVDGHVVWCMNPELYPPHGNKYTYHEVTPTGTYHVLYWATEYGYANKDTYYAEAYAGLNWAIGKLPTYGNAPTELTVSSPENDAYYDPNYKGQITNWIKTNINSGHIDNSWTQTLDLPDGVTLVTESDGRRYTNSATIPINERYYFYGDEKLKGTYTINISTNINRYSWWMYTPVSSNVQRLLSVWKEGQFSTSVNVEFEPYNPPEGYELKLTKKDSEGNYVPGVIFETCYDEDFTSSDTWTHETGADGTVTIPKWTGDTVYVREVSAPDYLIKSDEVKKIILRVDRVNELEFINKIQYKLKLTKKDTKGNYVPDVTFEVSYNEDFSGQKWTYKTGEDGTVTIPGWKGKTVYVREIDVPDHLVLSDQVKKVILKANTTNEVVFVNRNKSDLILAKKDSEGNYVPKVTFEVSYNEDFSGQTWRYETEADGKVSIPNWAGKKVYVREIKVPDYLVKSNEVKSIELRPDKVNEVVFINQIQYKLKLTKKDTEGNYVPNVTFEVSYNKDFKSDKWRYTTGEDGTVDVSNLLRKTVYVREIDVPDHLQKSNEVKKVTLQAKKINELEFVNQIKGGIKIIKKDGETNIPLANAIFRNKQQKLLSSCIVCISLRVSFFIMSQTNQ
ncbi:MSCRAMM family protein [Granulicatella balaenopterae]